MSASKQFDEQGTEYIMSLLYTGFHLEGALAPLIYSRPLCCSIVL